MKKISTTFLTGLFTMLPVLATLYILFWLATTSERLLGKGIAYVFPKEFYWPGMGVVAAVIIIFIIGLLMKAWVVRRLFELVEVLVSKIPLVKTVYGSLRDFVNFVSESGKRAENQRQVVMVKIGDTGMEAMGFVTRPDLRNLPAGIGPDDSIAVFLPLSYQIGGHTVLVPRSSVRPVEISMEQGMRFVLTGGMMTK